ncbi:MAG: hypothetical protein QN175_02985 [Armatimonadota bacterium]|nr:hypothetical protein [Armatimonadota bacterium]
MRTLPFLVFLSAVLVAAPASGVAAAQGTGPSWPVVLEAEEISYDALANVVTARGRVRVTHPAFRLAAESLRLDLQAQVLVAEGRVQLVDAAGREVRGERIVYRLAEEAATLEGAETVVRGVYVRAGRIDVTAQRLTVQEALVTICDPRQPLYRLTARRVEIVPEVELVAHQATAWLGSIRLITLPTYRVSLRPGERRGPAAPGLGSNRSDGLWVDYRYGYRLGEISGELHGKYGQHTGFFLLNTLRYDTPAWGVSLVTGRRQHEDREGILHPYLQTEVEYAHKPTPLGGLLPLSWRLAGGWFDDVDAAASATRVDGSLTLTADGIALGPRASLGASASYRYSAYGTGQQRSVVSASLAVTSRPSETTSLTAGYDLAAPSGTTPFLFDRVDATSTVFLAARHTTGDLRLRAAASHNFAVPETKLSAGAGVRLSPSLHLDVDAVYNMTTSRFEDVDYALTVRCDCATVTVGYRQVRQQIFLQVAFTVSERMGYTIPGP